MTTENIIQNTDKLLNESKQILNISPPITELDPTPFYAQTPNGPCTQTHNGPCTQTNKGPCTIGAIGAIGGKTIIFDCGANDGSSWIPRAEKDPNAIIYAFEPAPTMIKVLQEKTKDLTNYHIIPKALSHTKGKAKFHLAEQADHGCSSLKEFNENLDKTWPQRSDFKVTKTIEVDVTTLKDFIEEEKIPCIHYLHIDVQGSDLDVLKGLGDKINIVNAGVVEVARDENVALYKNQHTMKETIDFLQQTGKFRVFDSVQNDCYQNEFNVYFDRNY